MSRKIRKMNNLGSAEWKVEWMGIKSKTNNVSQTAVMSGFLL